MINVSMLGEHGTKYSVPTCRIVDIEETPPAHLWDLLDISGMLYPGPAPHFSPFSADALRPNWLQRSRKVLLGHQNRPV